MATPVTSIRPAPIVQEAVANNGGGRGMSHRLAQISDRYLEILRRATLPAFSDGEMSAIRDTCNGTLNEPASMIRGSLWLVMEDSLPDGLAEKWRIDGTALVEKLRKLSFPQEVRLIEDVEAYWASPENAGAA